MSRDYRLDGSQYLAVKTDVVRVVDIAFQGTRTGSEWVLDNHLTSGNYGISEVKYGNVHDLVLISDVRDPLHPLIYYNDLA